jgi:hypothetical protein
VDAFFRLPDDRDCAVGVLFHAGISFFYVSPRAKAAVSMQPPEYAAKLALVRAGACLGERNIDIYSIILRYYVK